VCGVAACKASLSLEEFVCHLNKTTIFANKIRKQMELTLFLEEYGTQCEKKYLFEGKEG
jgi:hypothetical protein